MKLTLTPKQQEYLKLCAPGNGKYFRCFAGSTGSGKTMGVIMIKILQALQDPGVKIGWFRKNVSDIRKTTIPSVKKALGECGFKEDVHYKYRQHPDMELTFTNGSQFVFFAADVTKDPELKKIRGLEITHAVMEEADQMSHTVFSMLRTRIGRHGDKNIKGSIDVVLNPSVGWVKTTFYEPAIEDRLPEDHAFFEISTHDNTFASDGYIESLEGISDEAFKQRYVLNNWNYTVGNNNLVESEWIPQIRRCRSKYNSPLLPLRSLGVDVAGEGRDKTVYAVFDGQAVTDLIVSTKTSKVDIANEVFSIMHDRKIDAKNVYVDAIGEGVGVVDYLKSKHVLVNAFKGSHKPVTNSSLHTFANRRAENYWYLRQLIRDEKLFIMDDMHELFKELTITSYERNSKGDLIIESKDKIKNKLGRSPDYADAVSMAISSIIEQDRLRANGLSIIG